MINQFLSPFFSLRDDQWGGSDEKRFRFLKETVLTVKKAIPENTPLLVKLNTNDHTPKEGVVPELAAKYAQWLDELGIDAIEVSSGTGFYSPMNMCRGDVPVAEFAAPLSWWMKPLAKMALKCWVGNFELEEAYHLDTAKKIKPSIGNTALCLVGGIRSKARMEEILNNGQADFLSMSRPFIREPTIVKKMREGKADKVACESCYKCLAAPGAEIPVKCYNKGFPSK
ncbi:MAG: hypothetical protein HOD85_27110 [Deltaproteobacteria bacterium]|nr:hypothetical protein [Deltaproteobacteria bacterium]